MFSNGLCFSLEVVGKKHRLTINQVNANHCGTVKFVASNAETEAKLIVLEPLVQFVSQIKDLIIEEKSEAKFECEVS